MLVLGVGVDISLCSLNPRRIKEQHCYCAPDVAKEYSKYDKDPRKFFRMYTGKRVRKRSDC